MPETEVIENKLRDEASQILGVLSTDPQKIKEGLTELVKLQALCRYKLETRPLEYKLEYYNPNPGGQKQFIKSQATERWLFGSNDSGKSTAGGVEDLLFALGCHPYREIKVPNTGWVVSVDYPNSRDVMQEKIFEWLPNKFVKRWRADEGILDIINGSGITFKSCVVGDTKVLMSNGIWKKIKYIKVGEEVISSNSYGPKAFKNRNNKVRELIALKDKECLEINTSYGYKLQCTLDHKIYSNGEFKESKEIKIGDKLIVYQDNLLNGISVDKWKPAILGSLISDGCLCTETILWSEPNKNSRDELRKYLPDYIRIVPVDKKGINFRISNPNGKVGNPIKNYLKELGLMGTKSKDKFIPEEVFNYDLECSKIFLRHLWNGDGWIGKNRTNYSTVSKVLAEDLHLFLLKFGIKSCLRRSKRNEYILSIDSNKNFSKFINFIEYIPKYKFNIELRKRNSNGEKRNWDKFVTVKEIKYIGRKDVYDIVLENPKTFYANGLFVFDCDSGREKFQGARKRWIHFDEQPNKEVYKECKARVMATQPLDVWGTMTPLEGYNWIYYEIYERQIPGTVECFHCPLDENIHLDSNSKQQLLNAYVDEADISARIYGRFQPRAGLIYAKYIIRIGENKTILDYSDVKIEPHYPRIMSIDPHPRNPSAVLFGAVMPNNDIVFYDEIYAESDVHQLATMILSKIKPTDRFIRRLIDCSAASKDQTSGKSVKDILGFQYKIHTTLADKDVLNGIAMVQRRLAVIDNKKPTLYFLSSCVNAIWEIEHYAWDDWSSREDRRDRKEKPVKKKDHQCDNVRYIVTSRPQYFVTSKYKDRRSGRSSVTGY